MKQTQAPVVAFVGDSFTRGAGLKNVHDRFSDIVAYNFNGCLKVENYGSDWFSTVEELNLVKSLNPVPDVIVLQYFFNDADIPCNEALGWYPNLDMYAGLSSIPKLIAKGSYLANFIFFWSYQPGDQNEYFDFFNECFHSEQGVLAYERVLLDLTRYCNEKGVVVYALIIPNTLNPNLSAHQDSIVIDIFNRIGIETITTDSLLIALPLKSRIVSSQDLHLSPLANQRVAERVSEVLQRHCTFDKSNIVKNGQE